MNNKSSLVVTFTVFGGKADITQGDRVYSMDNKPVKKTSNVDKSASFRINATNDSLSITYFKVKPAEGYT